MMSSSKDETIATLTARCLCKKHVYTTDIEASKLPLPAYACHCTSCRHCTGSLYSIDTPWPTPPASIDTSSLSSYAFSKRIQILFCGTCSTPMFWKSPLEPDKELGAFTGTIENVKGDGEVVRLAHHIYVDDTMDGGATMWLKGKEWQAGEKEVPRYKQGSQDPPVELLPLDWPPAESLTGYENKSEDSIPIRCHCKGVNFAFHRGNYAGKTKDELPWYIDPTAHKSLADFCACDSCRLFAGVDVVNWTYSALEYITDPSGQILAPTTSDLRALVDAKDAKIGSLKYIASHKDVQRYFCATCSACVFYATDSRPDMVDVATGVLDAKDGARAEGMLSWKFGKVDSLRDAEGGWREAWLRRIEGESEGFRAGRGYPESWFKS
ncbi:hypothetical protein P154DRAFT_555106 [Amniculicola lignicola CBS 123094]|uniref:CENP-V/GFA domain-containing protein n=1 Tax=Amniculicola lignicola CBS 123094 TaxID=1392246 RepID=A0A6A5W9Y6_9PLEO|nr:hypothetical protein P154DRAFT_555106 [Amniculicola lignicola CBS 123094]